MKLARAEGTTTPEHSTLKSHLSAAPDNLNAAGSPSSQDSVRERTQRVPEAEAGRGGRLGPRLRRRAGVRPPLCRLRRRLCLLRLQRARVLRGGRGAAQLRHRPGRPAVPVGGMSEQGGANRQAPEQGQGAAVHR